MLAALAATAVLDRDLDEILRRGLVRTIEVDEGCGELFGAMRIEKPLDQVLGFLARGFIKDGVGKQTDFVTCCDLLR